MNENHQPIIKKLETKKEMLTAYPLLTQMYHGMKKDEYEIYLNEMIETNNFMMVAAFENNQIVGVAGYWILRMLYCGRYVQVSSFVVDQEKRGSGIGKRILDAIAAIAEELKCQKIILDSYTENKQSHALYYRENFYIRGFHFMKDLQISPT